MVYCIKFAKETETKEIKIKKKKKNSDVSQNKMRNAKSIIGMLVYWNNDSENWYGKKKKIWYRSVINCK